uniref:Uncharacterized protein n=1 Tax=Anguilla anguilla TaxID=7936 RepID=A0A0E9UN27_ANGAN
MLSIQYCTATFSSCGLDLFF